MNNIEEFFFQSIDCFVRSHKNQQQLIYLILKRSLQIEKYDKVRDRTKFID